MSTTIPPAITGTPLVSAEIIQDLFDYYVEAVHDSDKADNLEARQFYAGIQDGMLNALSVLGMSIDFHKVYDQVEGALVPTKYKPDAEEIWAARAAKWREEHPGLSPALNGTVSEVEMAGHGFKVGEFGTVDRIETGEARRERWPVRNANVPDPMELIPR